MILFSPVFSLEKQADIGFLYGVLGRMSSQKDITTVLQDSSIIHTGDEITINVGYKKETHIYAIYKGSEGEFDILYHDTNKIDEHIADLPDTTFKTVLNWALFSDPAGYETFFLINSTVYQENLVNLFQRYNKVNEKGRKKIAKQIQNEIDHLNPENKEDIASIGSRLNKPVVGGVTFRGEGDEDELKDKSVTHSCIGNSEIAFKKIILNHQ